MKITKNLLREMIEEEMKVIQLGLGQPLKAHGYMGGSLGIGSGEQEEIHGDRPKDPDGYEGSMAKSNLYNLRDDSSMLCHLIQDDENLEPWVEEKIAVAASMLSSVARHMKYQKVKD
jgi:hypothetical protein